MKATEAWRPTKFEVRAGRLRASRDPLHVNPGSVLTVDRAARSYERALRNHVWGRLVDLGCGGVPLYGTYRDLVTDVLTVDWDGGAHGQQHVDLLMDLNQPLELPDASCDTVVLTDVLEHVYEPAALLAEVARILVPGGTAIVGVPFLYWIHEAPHDYYRYTRHALERLTADAGLVVLAIEETGGRIDVLFDLALRSARARPAIQRAFASAAAPLLGSRLANRSRRSTRRRFPLGYTLVALRPTPD